MNVAMARKRVALTKALAMALNCAAFASTATACAICVLGSDSFQMPHPHALRIAAATREAIEGGRLKVERIERPEDLESTLLRVAELLNYASRESRPVVIDFVLIDEEHTFRVESQGARSNVALLTGETVLPPDGRIIATVHAIRGLGNRELQLLQAIRLGLIEVESNAAPPAAAAEQAAAVSSGK